MGRRIRLVSGPGGAQILLVRVFSGLVDGVASGGNVLADTFDGVTGSGACREKESDSCECRLHDVCLHVPSATVPTITTTPAGTRGSSPGSTMGHWELQQSVSVGEQVQFNTQAICVTGLLSRKESHMLSWAIVFFVLALVAAAFGFGGIAGASASIAQILFVIFLVLTVLAFVVRAFQGRSVL
jgi:uncharacterized membrane protein YtjA (UPF0391 family)